MSTKRTVIFLGLADLERTPVEGDLRTVCDQIWTLNDWYCRVPTVPTPDRVFNIHRCIEAHSQDPERFQGDTVEAYNASGAEIVTTWPDSRLQNNRVFDLSRVLDIRFDQCFSSTLAWMFLLAWIERWERIRLVGCNLSNKHSHMVSSVLTLIQESERRGIEVECPLRDEWTASASSIASWQAARAFRVFTYAAEECGKTDPPFKTFDPNYGGK
jgi:hypothetical protein